jgi:hypothetical protein
VSLGKHFIFGYDDSGGVEPLLKKDGTPQPGDHPYTLIATVGLNSDLKEEFDFRWTELRSKIGKEIGIDYLPPIHARLMLGKDRPHAYREKPNPYFLTTHEQGVDWILEGFKILKWASVKKNGCGVLATSLARKPESDRLFTALQNQTVWMTGLFLNSC